MVAAEARAPNKSDRKLKCVDYSQVRLHPRRLQQQQSRHHTHIHLELLLLLLLLLLVAVVAAAVATVVVVKSPRVQHISPHTRGTRRIVTTSPHPRSIVIIIALQGVTVAVAADISASQMARLMALARMATVTLAAVVSIAGVMYPMGSARAGPN